MKIVLYGEAHVNGSGDYCYAESLKELGHDVVVVRNDANLEWYGTPLGRVTRKALGRPLEPHRRRHAAAVIEVVRRERPALVIVLKGLFVGAADVQAMQRLGAFVVVINHDDFYSRNPNNWSATQREGLARYDHVFVTREVNVSEVARVNPRVELLLFAYYPKIHRPIAIADSERSLFETDVVFVGTWEAERCRLLEHLVERVHARYAIWGTGWGHIGRRSPLRPFIVNRAAMMDDQCKAIGGSKIALAFLRKANRDDYTQRTFEVPACGGLLLAERTARHLSFYREGVEAEFFDPAQPEELVTKVRLLLADDARRRAIREAGQRALERQHHTYRDRLIRVLEVQRNARAPAVDSRPP